MVRDNQTTIALSKETRDKLFNLKESPEDSYEDVLKKLLRDGD